MFDSVLLLDSQLLRVNGLLLFFLSHVRCSMTIIPLRAFDYVAMFFLGSSFEEYLLSLTPFC